MSKKPMFAMFARMAVILSVLAALATPASLAAQNHSSPTMQMQASPPQPQQAPAAAEAPSAPLIIPAGPNYAKDIPWFPKTLMPFEQQQVPEPVMVNSPKLDQLIRQGQLQMSLQDAIQLAIENNLSIGVQRYIAWIADTNVLKTLAGPPGLSFDPIVSATLGLARASIPVNNPFISGTGVLTRNGLTTHNAQANFAFTKGFKSGTLFSLGFNNTRASSTSPAVFFNPDVQSTLSFSFQQQLLNGFGFLPNTQFILEAQNDSQAARYTLENQVMAVVASVEDAYWNLVYARADVAVQQTAVDWAQKNLQDTQKQLQIGTLAQLDVVTAQSQLASSQQALIVAQTNELQQQTALLNLITRNPMAAGLENVQVVPTASINTPPQVNMIPYRDAVEQAWKDRPDLLAQELALDNANIAVKGTRNALLPTLTLSGNYSTEGLAGNSKEIVTGQTTILPAGLLDSWDTLINQNFPTYSAALTLSFPLRNRAAQAASAQAQLQQRESLLSLQSLKNNIAESVRNAQIAIQQGLANVQAAVKARQLAQESLDAEQKKFQYGTSTDYNVILQERDLATAQGNEIQAKVGLIEAVVAFNEAVGRTLHIHNISIADAASGHVVQPPLIPGTPVNSPAGNAHEPSPK
ncbi:MAG TPA: TolC family protein [Candidatus Dormibacteraeota bacterium]|nr:TolC family protein [Candidatus Dormibacteraeota bacterium]